MNIKAQLSRAKNTFLNDSLFRNAVLLMASTAIVSILGFGFWIFVAHLYSPSEIGVASALIAVTVLLSNLSLLGLNSGIIRYLPKSDNQSKDINAALILVGTVTMLAATIYVLIAGKLGIALSILDSNWHKAGFVLVMATVSLNSLTDAVFIANRRAELHTATYALLGVVKLILPVLLIPLGSLGIFSAYSIATVMSLLFSMVLMKRWCNYRFRSAPNWLLLKRTRAYTTKNHLGVIIAGLPSQLLPLLIIRKIGSAEVAYFSMAWAMANLLYIIPSAAAQSLLAEGSHDPTKRAHHLQHTTKMLALILVPAVVLSVLVAPYLLRIFGAQYASGSTTIFQLLALATFPFAITTICNALLNLEQRPAGIVVAQLVLLVVTFGSAGPLLHMGLFGIGIAVLLGSIAACLTHLYLQFFRRKRKPAGKLAPEIVPQSLQEF